MSADFSMYVDDPEIPVEEFTTYYVYLNGSPLCEEVNGVGRVEFGPVHVQFFDERGILICVYLAHTVTNVEQSVAA